MQNAGCTIFALALLFSAPLAAQTMVLEAEAETVNPCDFVHVVFTCTEKHVDNVAALSAGELIQLDGEKFVIDWTGPGYHLESGLVIEPLGQAVQGLRGQRWLEVYPQQEKVHTSHAWTDVDGNRALSASDTLALDSGPALRVEDVRLQLRVRPAPPEP